MGEAGNVNCPGPEFHRPRGPLSKPEGARRIFPSAPDAYVYKLGKMFALLYEKDGQARVNLKCEPLQAQLRDVFQSVIPGWHMNKNPLEYRVAGWRRTAGRTAAPG